MKIEKLREFGIKHVAWLTILGLFIICYFIFFYNIGSYSLMDVDETRYVSMSRHMFNTKDFLTLYLNGNYFFEKPPLYFWGECLSFAIFGKINEFTARFPVALDGTFLTLLTYFVAKKIVNKKVGVISALILATSLEFVILAKYSILDIVLATCTGFATLFGFLTFFVTDKNKKYFWWLFYAFTGLAVMAKGIPGLVIPFGTIFISSIITKRFKEVFKPQYWIVGIPLFLLIVLPWHIIMLKIHDPLFFNEYIIKHHLARFMGSKELGREQPFYFFFLTFLWGFIPWIFSMLAVGIAKLKKFSDKSWINKIKNFNFDTLDNKHKFLTLNWIGFWVTMLFFSSSATKLITYILPIYVFAANIMGIVWYDYIQDKFHEKAINISVYIIGSIFTLAGIVACFTKLFLPADIYSAISSAQIFVILLVLFFGITSVISAKRKNYSIVFTTYIIFIACLSAFGTKLFFNIDYSFGQNDLINYAKSAAQTGKNIVTIGFGRRYSLNYYSNNDNHVEYNEILDFNLLKKSVKNPKNMVIVRTKHLDEISKNAKIIVLQKGIKYSVIK